ncbi:MAG: TldD/PmbA family protein [Asticcacaulis sp.]
MLSSASPTDSAAATAVPASAPVEDLALLESLLSQAKALGADAAEAVLAQSRTQNVTVRQGALENVESDEHRDLGLRVFIGQQQAVVSISDLSAEARQRMVERAVAMAKLAPEDPYAGLADPAQIAKGPFADLDLYDTTELEPTRLMALAAEAEAAALSVAGVSKSDSAYAGQSYGDHLFLTSGGFCGYHKGSGFYISASAIAERDGAMERDGEGRTARWFADLPAPEAIGRIAGERAAASLGARKIDSVTAPVLFDRRIAKSLIGPMLGAISGAAIARGTSFLKDKLEKPVFAKGIRISEDPFRPRGLGSCHYDSEGLAVQARDLIADGILKTWLLNTASARQLGLTSTGHASRSLAGPPGTDTHNVVMQPGQQSPEALMAAAGSGLLVTNMFGPSLNHDTGDWSAGVGGFWFENGEIAFPVNEITVAGNLIEIYARLVPASDLEIRGTRDVPSLLVDALSIGGK